jgi:hypothetical protein
LAGEKVLKHLGDNKMEGGGKVERWRDEYRSGSVGRRESGGGKVERCRDEYTVDQAAKEDGRVEEKLKEAGMNMGQVA